MRFHATIAFFNKSIIFSSYPKRKNFIKESSARRNGEQFTIGMLKSAAPYC
ncbi:hypothetical protein HMPREF9554_02186 [Treponema phagedenis F0421]|nr:hypothetical protein HMPREF9554_02186 [Treponema phagedenis F0421]